MATERYRLAGVLAIALVAGTTAIGWRGVHSPGPAVPRVTSLAVPWQAAAIHLPSASPQITPEAAAAATASPKLSARALKSCPAAAAACVDLTDHMTWLQTDGRISYGPVPMEPGPPGTSHQTPRGTFHVQWKAGPDYVSTEYNEPMPYAVFFAPGGIAFHGGSLTEASHGCVHLDIGNAKYYHDHLPIGAEVVVF
jgi:L,D-transpeptidase catalytic domain